MKTSWVMWLISALVIVAAGVLLFINGARFSTEQTRRSLMSGVHVGMTRAEVIAAKGQPDHVARSLKDMWTVNYYPAPSRSVEKEVLQYHDFVWKLYVYIGRDDRVTYLHLTNT